VQRRQPRVLRELQRSLRLRGPALRIRVFIQPKNSRAWLRPTQRFKASLVSEVALIQSRFGHVVPSREAQVVEDYRTDPLGDKSSSYIPKVLAYNKNLDAGLRALHVRSVIHGDYRGRVA
jgi:hypothetical protein